MPTPALRCTAFAGTHRIASGELRHVALKAKQVFDSEPDQPILVFEDASGRVVELPLGAACVRAVAHAQCRAGEAPKRRFPHPLAGRDARGSAWLPARSRCCHVIGIGCPHNLAALR